MILSSTVAPLPSSIVKTVYLLVISSMATTAPVTQTYLIGWLRWKYMCWPMLLVNHGFIVTRKAIPRKAGSARRACTSAIASFTHVS